ncbi:MAG: redoxin domain-containing protein [Chloroflexi bacterium]|nr:redoxin domain-containing protein [Chloroflexota bacterium]
MVRCGLRPEHVRAAGEAAVSRKRALTGACGNGLKARILDHNLLHQTAPDFTLADSDGQFLSLSDFRGRTVLLVFLRHFA